MPALHQTDLIFPVVHGLKNPMHHKVKNHVQSGITPRKSFQMATLAGVLEDTLLTHDQRMCGTRMPTPGQLLVVHRMTENLEDAPCAPMHGNP